MQIFGRWALVVMGALVGWMAGYWLVGPWASVVVAAALGGAAWVGTRGQGSLVVRTATLWAALGGIIGFVGGFFGPMLLGGGNQGPLLGLFITGPGGVILGAVAGAIVGLRRSGG